MNISQNNLYGFVLKLTQYNDLILAVMIMAVISLMILPTPAPLVDLMIAANLCLAVSLMMLTLYIPSSLAFSTFPTLLLFTTLFRLALNITTTRQILLHAYAGKIILTFGNFVVGGNYIVGGVVFLIITIVQFLVIAKGSERVAEVSARFTLDAMPGKQMSIDADLRAGVIDMPEAKRRRLDIENESKLFGAMDGAMKFVKGDAIAGLIITVINIIGGISIGTLQKGMEFGQALQKYTILTIGDGLVSQIPALFISITAGIIVTRVNVSEGADHLGGEIGNQILKQPKAMFITGGMLLAMMMIPGFPKGQFLFVGTLIGGIGAVLLFAAKKYSETEESAEYFSVTQPETEQKLSTEFSLTVPLLIDVNQEDMLTEKRSILNSHILQAGNGFYHELGIPFPGISFRYNDQLPKDTYYILVQEIPMYSGKIPTNKFLLCEPEQRAREKKFKFEKDRPFLPDLPTLWVDSSQVSKLDSSNFRYFDAPMIITHHLAFALRKHAVDFIGMTETKQLVNQMEAHFPDLVKETLNVASIQKVTEILQGLVQEEVSIRNLKLILESIAEWGQKEKEVLMLTEYARMSLKRWLCYRYADHTKTLHVLLIDPNLEETLRNAIRKSSVGIYLSLAPDVSQKFIEKIKNEIISNTKMGTKICLLTAMDIRRHVKKLIETELPQVPVLSYQELTSDAKIQPINKISLS